MARPAKKYDPEIAKQIQAWAQYGIPHEDIARNFKISLPVLYRLYRVELDMGKAQANAKIGERLFKKAMDGDNSCLIFWAKTQMGWREKEHPADVAQTMKQDRKAELVDAIREAYRSVGKCS